MDRSEWTREHLERPGARAVMAKLEEAAWAEHERTRVRIADHSLAELEQLLSAAFEKAPAPDYPLEHVHCYLPSCRKFERFYGRGLLSAADVHARAVTGAWPAAVRERDDDRLAPTGATGSTIAAPWNGVASWAPGRPGQRQAARRWFVL